MNRRPLNKDNRLSPQASNISSAKTESTGHESVQLFRQLQETIGNEALGRRIQAKLKVSQPDDSYEQEADRVADQVMRMPEASPPTASQQTGPQIQRLCTDCEEEEAMRKTAEEEEEEKVCGAEDAQHRCLKQQQKRVVLLLALFDVLP